MTARAAVLGLVVCALMLSLAYPIKQYLSQQSRISQLRQQNADAQRQVDSLERRKQQLGDPAYVRAQARQRLQYVLPGETPFVVIRKGEHPSGPGPTSDGRLDRNSPWYGQLWSSVQRADRAP